MIGQMLSQSRILCVFSVHGISTTRLEKLLRVGSRYLSPTYLPTYLPSTFASKLITIN